MAREFLQYAVAKIRNRYFWCLEDWGTDPLTLKGEGFTQTREAAVDALAGALEAIDPDATRWRATWWRGEIPRDIAKARANHPGASWNWLRAHTSRASHATYRYSQVHARKPQSDATGARMPLGNVYTHYDSDQFGSWWTAHSITKVTKESVFVLYYGDRVIRLDRAKLDQAGAVSHRPTYRFFWSESGYQKELNRQNLHQAESTQHTADRKRFGLFNVPLTEEAVVSGFRRLAIECHPDHGGDPAAFRDLVATRDRLLAEAKRLKRQDRSVHQAEV